MICLQYVYTFVMYHIKKQLIMEVRNEKTSKVVASKAAYILQLKKIVDDKKLEKDIKSTAASALAQTPDKHINLHPRLWGLLRLGRK